jgi:hypothetical protein
VATGISQLSLTVSQLNSSQVALLVQNSGAAPAQITGIYIQGIKGVSSIDAGGQRYTVTTRDRSLPGVRATAFKPDIAIKSALRTTTTLRSSTTLASSSTALRSRLRTSVAPVANVVKTGQAVKIVVTPPMMISCTGWRATRCGSAS